jgi:positive regulator of sigma E activity
MTRIGKVVREEGRGVMVRFERPAACTGCGACSRGQKTTTIYALGMAKVGDIVSVRMPEGESKSSAWLNHVLLGLGFACGLLLGYLISGTVLAMVLGGILGMVFAGAVRWGIDQRRGKESAGQAQVLLVNAPQVLAGYQKLSTCPKAGAWKGVLK